MTTETTQGYREIEWPPLTLSNAGAEVLPAIPSSLKWPLNGLSFLPRAVRHDPRPHAPVFFSVFTVDFVCVAFLDHFETQSSLITKITPLGPPAAILLSRTHFPKSAVSAPGCHTSKTQGKWRKGNLSPAEKHSWVERDKVNESKSVWEKRYEEWWPSITLNFSKGHRSHIKISDACSIDRISQTVRPAVMAVCLSDL